MTESPTTILCGVTLYSTRIGNISSKLMGLCLTNVCTVASVSVEECNFDAMGSLPDDRESVWLQRSLDTDGLEYADR